MRQMEPVKFSKYAEECTDILGAANEHPSDAHLVQICRLSQIGADVQQVLPLDPTSQYAAPVELVLRTLQSKLSTFYANIPPRLKEHRMSLLIFSADND